jgi:hypothetical protein
LVTLTTCRASPTPDSRSTSSGDRAGAGGTARRGATDAVAWRVGVMARGFAATTAGERVGDGDGDGDGDAVVGVTRGVVAAAEARGAGEGSAAHAVSSSAPMTTSNDGLRIHLR